jgi:TP901 family phage tail tape measure protein
MSERDLKLKVLFSMVEKITAPLKRIQAGTKASAESVKNLRQKIGDLNEQQSNINGFKKLAGTLRETSEKLTGAELRAAQLKAQIEASVAPNKTLWREYDRAQNKVKILTNALHTEGEQLEQIQTKLHRAGIRTERLGDHEKSLQSNVAKTNRELAEQRQQLDALTAKTHKAAKAKQLYQRTQAMAGKIAMAGAGMGAAGAVTAAGLKVPVTAYAAAEDSKMQLKVSMMQEGGKVSAEFEKINALAMKLGDKLPGTTSDYLDMMTMLQRQGLSANNVLGGTGEATALLAVQLKKLPSEAAEFAAKMQDATGTTEADMLKLMDVIQRTYYLGVDDNDMLQAITKMSPAMKTLRKNGLEAVNAMAPLMVMFDQAGMKGEAGGNAVRKVLDLSMDKKKRDKVNKELKPHGINLNFSDGKGEFAGMDHMFAQFQKLKKLNRETTLAALKDQFGDDAETQQVLTILIDKGKEGYEEVIAKMKAQADLQTRVNAQLGTLKNLWEAASGTFTNTMVAFGESISPELKELTNWIGDTSASVGAWARENPKLAGTLMKITALIAIVLIVLGGLMLGISAVLMPMAVLRFAMAGVGIQGGIMATGLKVLRIVLSGLGTALGFVSRAILFMGRAMLLNPIGLIITGIAVAAYLIYKYWDPIKNFFKGVWDKVTAFFSSGIGNISAQILNWSPLGLMYRAFAGVMNYFGVSMPATLSGFFGKMWEALKAFASSGIGNIAKTILEFSPLGLFVSAFEKVFTYFSGLPARFKQAGKDIVSGVVSGLENKNGELNNSVYGMAASMGYKFAKTLGIQSPSRVFMRLGEHSVDGITAGLKNKETDPLDMLSSMTKRLTQIGGSLGAGLALSLGTAQANPLKFDQRKPLASSSQTSTTAAPSNNTFNIYPSPGMDPQAIARAVAAELDKRDRQQAARSRSSLHDGSEF